MAGGLFTPVIFSKKEKMLGPLLTDFPLYTAGQNLGPTVTFTSKGVQDSKQLTKGMGG